MLFDDVLEKIGEGIFQKFAIVVCGLSTLAEGIAANGVPFAVILVSCDLKINADQILGLNAVFVGGTLVSGYWLGGISDMSGRKYILSTTSIITFVGCFVASFSQCVIMLYVSLFLLGFGLGGNRSATRIFVIEITPKSCRGSRLIILEIFWALGYAIAVGLARILVPPLAYSFQANHVRLNSWRILFGLSGSLSIFSACLMSVFPASPRWLLGKKKEEDAIDILRKIYAVNKVKHEETFPVKYLGQNIRLDPILHVNTRPESHVYQCNNPVIRSFRNTRIYTKHLFKKNLIKVTFASIVICTCMFDGITMMNMWLGLAVYRPNLDSCMLNGAFPIVSNVSEMCNPNTLEKLFKTNSYLSLCSFFVVILLCCVDKIPRKYILMVSALLSSAADLALIFLKIDYLRIAMAFITMSFLFLASVVVEIIILESFPTVLRSTAYGCIKLFPKTFLICLILFLKVECQWALISFGVLFACAGMFALLLPNLNMRPMKD